MPGKWSQLALHKEVNASKLRVLIQHFNFEHADDLSYCSNTIYLCHLPPL